MNKKFSYLIEMKNNEVVRLHLQENRNGSVIGKTYPESEEFFNNKDLIATDLNSWLDFGLEAKIFDTLPIPNSSC